jgi:hypothetical protein
MTTISLSELQEALQKLSSKDDNNSVNISDCKFFKVGKKYFIRTVTHYHLGELVAEGDIFIGLKDCAWVADTKRFHEFVITGIGSSSEIEMFPKNKIVGVNKNSIIDFVEWDHALPTQSQ